MPVPMRPTRTWPTRSHRLSRSICPGDEDCEYEPKVTGVGARVMSSGCNIVWRTYSEAIFEAFRNANPDLQYKNHHPCVLEAQRTGHRCPGRNCGGGRGTPLDHDELARFPDNGKIIISHPYPNGDTTEVLWMHMAARPRVRVADWWYRAVLVLPSGIILGHCGSAAGPRTSQPGYPPASGDRAIWVCHMAQIMTATAGVVQL